MTKPAPPPAGVYVPTLLFFKEDEEFDVPAIKTHTLRLAKAGVTGIIVQGSTGEAQLLSHEERKEAIRLIRQTLDENGFRNVIIIAGTGAQSVRETKKLNIDAKEAGATFALVLSPSTWKTAMTKEALIRFHREVADASPLPIIIYNFATVTAGIDLDYDTIAELGEHPNIVGTKLSCGNIAKVTRLVATFPSSEFVVFMGRAEVLLPSVFMGASGGILALANIVPKAHVHMLKLWQEGKVNEARDIQRLLSHSDASVSKSGGIGFSKSVIAKEFGYGGPTVRMPLQPSSVDRLTGRGLELLNELISLEKTVGNIIAY